MRSKLRIKGRVQGVGYRAMVSDIAQNFGIKGIVTNLKDKTVEIYCEYLEKEIMEDFKKAINIKQGGPIGINVRNIEEYGEGTLEYGTPSEEIFKDFSVSYGKDLSEFDQDQADRSERTVLYGIYMYHSMNNGFETLGSKVDAVGQKVDVVGQKVDVVGQKVDVVGQKVDDMHTDINLRFDSLDEKYGSISKILANLLEQQIEINKRMEEHNKKLDEILDRLTKSSKKRTV